MEKLKQIAPATGKLGILTPGLGAVATTFIAGVIASRNGLGQPIGSLTQMGRIRVGKRTEHRQPLIKEFVPLYALDQVVFGGWDIFEDNVYQAASHAKVLDQQLLDALKPELEQIKPMSAVFDSSYIRNITGPNIKKGASKMDLAEQLMADIQNFKTKNDCERLVIVWCASTEAYIESSAVHATLATFEQGLRDSAQEIAPSQIYAYAALKCGVPFANGAPNLTCDIPAMVELSQKTKVAISGKDFKTGQTLMKTVVAPGLNARALGVRGWFSTNILGNRDGEVLDAPENFRTKEVSKGNVLDGIFNAELQPELYGELYHKIRINYYPPHGDNKESWDNIDIFGWLGYHMQIKINFLCRDSILAAPIVLDLALLMDLSQRAGLYGIQEWLSFYYKAPQTMPGLPAEHDIFKQLSKLENTLRYLMGEDLITHLGQDYYEEFNEQFDKNLENPA
jgi:myo-inositol-1-phosphate synthase